MKKIDAIKTERLILRPLCSDDLYEVNDYSANADNTKYLTLPNTNLKETQEYLKWVSDEWNKDIQTYYGFAVTLNGKLIGEIAFGGEYGTNEVSIGWIIHRDFWNCGYATEATAAIIDFCFNSMGITKITTSCDIENTASRRIMEKLGMQLESEHKPWEYRDGKLSKEGSYFLQKYN